MDYAIGMFRKAKTDAYMMTMYKNKKLKTKVKIIEENGNPIDWNQEIWVPAQIPVLSDEIVFKLMDQDEIIDETVGSIKFKYKDILD